MAFLGINLRRITYRQVPNSKMQSILGKQELLMSTLAKRVYCVALLIVLFRYLCLRKAPLGDSVAINISTPRYR